MDNVTKLDISKFLPHRAPFLLVNDVLSIGNDHVTTSFEITKDNIFVENNKFIEVGLLENAAQTCSSIVGKSYFEDDDLDGKGTKLIGFISAVKKVTVFSIPEVGSKIITKAILKSKFDATDYTISTLICSIFEGERELLFCEMNLFIQEVNNHKEKR